MSKPQLWKVVHENKKEGYKLECYTDAFVYDIDTEKKKSALAAIRFGGDPEMVRALSDAIYGGASVEIDAGNEPIQLQSLTKQYRRQISHDGVYAEATLIVQDDAPAIKEREEKSAGQTVLDDPPRKCYIFCQKDDAEQLFEQTDRRTCVPLIPAIKDYLLAELKRRGILKQLAVFSHTVQFDVWMLCCSAGDKNIIAVVEDGLRSGAISIPGATPENAAAFESVNTVSQYLKAFGVTIAERIKGQFSPLFDPAAEPLSGEVLTVNQNIRAAAGYSLYGAQLAAAEALKRKLDMHEPALLIAECGSGKSKIGVTGLYASHLAAGKAKSFNVVLCPSHITEKWVREIEETIPQSFAGVIHSIAELKKFYSAYEKGTRTAFAILSKEKARDGYMHRPVAHWSTRRNAFLCPDCNRPIMEELTDDGSKYEVVAEPPFFRTENDKNHKCRECGTILWAPLIPGEQSEWVKVSGFGFAHLDELMDAANGDRRTLDTLEKQAAQQDRGLDELQNLVDQWEKNPAADPALEKKILQIANRLYSKVRQLETMSRMVDDNLLKSGGQVRPVLQEAGHAARDKAIEVWQTLLSWGNDPALRCASFLVPDQKRHCVATSANAAHLAGSGRRPLPTNPTPTSNCLNPRRKRRSFLMRRIPMGRGTRGRVADPPPVGCAASADALSFLVRRQK